PACLVDVDLQRTQQPGHLALLAGKCRERANQRRRQGEKSGGPVHGSANTPEQLGGGYILAVRYEENAVRCGRIHAAYPYEVDEVIECYQAAAIPELAERYGQALVDPAHHRQEVGFDAGAIDKRRTNDDDFHLAL